MPQVNHRYTNCASDNDNMLETLSDVMRKSVNRNISFEAHYNVSHKLCTTLSVPQENVLQSQAVSYIAGAICHFVTII